MLVKHCGFHFEKPLCLIQYCLKLMKDELACSDAKACTYLVLTMDALELYVFYATREFIILDALI